MARPANARWSSSASASASRSSPPFSSIQSETSFSPSQRAGGGASPVSRSRTISPIAVASGTSARLRARVIGSVRIRTSTALVEIGAHPRHRPRAERLDPRLLDGVEHRARDLVGGGVARVQRGSWWRSLSAAPSAKPRASATSRSGKARPGIGTLMLLARAGRGVGGEAQLDLGLARDRPRRAGQDEAEAFEGVVRLGHGRDRPGQLFPTTLSGRSLPNTR